MSDNVWVLTAIIMGAALLVYVAAQVIGRFEYKQNLKDDHITRTKIIAVNETDPTPSTLKAAARAAVGGFIAGDAGAAYGALTTKGKPVRNIYTFLVYYDNRKDPAIEKVIENSARFQTPIKKLKG